MEGIPDFLLADSPWPLGSRFLVRKAEDIQQSSRPKHFGKTTDEHRAFFVGKGVEQPAIDHRVELPPSFFNSKALPTMKWASIPR